MDLTILAIIAAVENALEPFGVRITEFPITPQRIVRLIAAARSEEESNDGEE